MNLRRITWLVFGTLLLLLPGEATAMPPLCDQVCGPAESCDKTCWEYPGSPATTCGAWGSCAGACNPTYIPVNSYQVGGFSIDYASPFMCEYVAVRITIWHDISNCQGSSDYQTCSAYIETTRGDHQCCVFNWCGGQQSC